jgi:small redox-active disulfide protein 2
VKIQILGTGCPKCKKTAENAEKAVETSGADAEIVKVDKIQDIMDFGVMMTPALAIDGNVKVSGKVPAPEQIVEWIKKEKASERLIYEPGK